MAGAGKAGAKGASKAPAAAVSAAVSSRSTWEPEGAPLLTRRCHSAVSAASFFTVPSSPDSLLFAAHEHNHVCLATGHEDGALSVWWLGDNDTQASGGGSGSAADSGAASIAGGSVAVGTGLGLQQQTQDRREEAYMARLHREPLAQYPALHASQGRITHITPSFVVDHSGYGSGALREAPWSSLTSPPAAAAAAEPPADPLSTTLASFAPSATDAPVRGPTTSTVLCVGVKGMRGWRVFSFDHVLPHCYTAAVVASALSAVQYAKTSTSTAVALGKGKAKARAPMAAGKASAAAGKSVGSAVPEGNVPNYVPGHWVWDDWGRRHYEAPRPLFDEHLKCPWIRIPSLADCLRAPVIGAPTWPGNIGASPLDGIQTERTHVDGRFAQSEPVSAGLLPLGCSISLLSPSVDDAFPLHDSFLGAPVTAKPSDDLQYAQKLIALSFGVGESDAHDIKSTRAPRLSRDSRFMVLPHRSSSKLIGDTSAWRLLAQGQSALPSPAALAAAGAATALRGAGILAANGASRRANIVQAPRAMVILLTENGLHISGFDFHEALATSTCSASRGLVAAQRISKNIPPFSELTKTPLSATANKMSPSESFVAATVLAEAKVSKLEILPSATATAPLPAVQLKSSEEPIPVKESISEKASEKPTAVPAVAPVPPRQQTVQGQVMIPFTPIDLWANVQPASDVSSIQSSLPPPAQSAVTEEEKQHVIRVVARAAAPPKQPLEVAGKYWPARAVYSSTQPTRKTIFSAEGQGANQLSAATIDARFKYLTPHSKARLLKKQQQLEQQQPSVSAEPRSSVSATTRSVPLADVYKRTANIPPSSAIDAKQIHNDVMEDENTAGATVIKLTDARNAVIDNNYFDVDNNGRLNGDAPFAEDAPARDAQAFVAVRGDIGQALATLDDEAFAINQHSNVPITSELGVDDTGVVLEISTDAGSEIWHGLLGETNTPKDYSTFELHPYDASTAANAHIAPSLTPTEDINAMHTELAEMRLQVLSLRAALARQSAN
jgi:hypothetical protein